MIEAAINNHYKNIQAWTKSASLNRQQLQKTTETTAAISGVYKVRLEGSNVWQIMERVPAAGAQEWLYLSGGLPIFYWNRNSERLILI